MDTESSPSEFWADAIKRLSGEPLKRLNMARDNMPFPAAFREAAIALRALVRERRKSGEENEDLLGLLYLTAAQHDFLHHTPYIEGIGPGYNVAERIPRQLWENLDLPYDEVGYSHLPLLNKTDIKWITAAWGEPSSHCSPQELHGVVWSEYVAQTRSGIQTDRRAFEEELRSLVGDAENVVKQPSGLGRVLRWFRGT